MDGSDSGIIGGIAAGVGVAIAMYITSRRNRKIGVTIEPVLRERGPMTLPALAEALGMGGFYARGKVVLALNDLINAGKVEVIPAPEGTPQLQKVNHVQYRWRA